MQNDGRVSWTGRLPFFYGWIVVGVAFVTVALGVTARTAFSLMFPPIVDEFGWDRGLAAGAFSFGFLVSALMSPVVGRLMDRRGPRFVIEIGVLLTAAGLVAATRIETPWQLYATLGVLVGAGANCMTFTAQSQYLPNWFVRRRALAISIAFSGAGFGAILILPWIQEIILHQGWRRSCLTLGVMTLAVLLPLNLLVRKRPEDIGVEPDGDGRRVGAAPRPSNIVDPAWAAIEWTTARAMRTARFWWIALAYFCGGFVWYAVQVHQTKYLVEIGFSPMEAAWALGLVAMAGVPGQIFLGALSDRIGREIVWSITGMGFAICYAALLALAAGPSQPLLYVMVLSQGLLGYAMTSVMGPIVAEIFEGPHFGSIFGVLTVALIGGGAAGPLIAGMVHDRTGGYGDAFILSIALCFLSIIAIWRAAPGRVRLVAGRARARALADAKTAS
ncbi:MFS transporter [Enhydrobacter sp.]|uniref:MFS transporter n=1 Tax=Enhydrobacter sp. TaxID=1894999 RepID=UPI0026037715|nr:MFS transporter [Enhydrobacter sp.]WIM13446.1 MAG: putative MFS-type transporter [Enhydrobacter sp.]